jgi:hydroxymethylbilane synthase
MKDQLRIGTRGSKLALAQTNQVVEILRRFPPGVRYEIVAIRTQGDKMHDLGDTAIEGKSMFTKEIEESLLKGEIDMAVHSMKDLTTELPKGLVIAAVPERVNPRDVFVSRNKMKFDELLGGARVGTSSPRRRAQLLAARGDLRILDMHGNVDTRLRSLENGDYDAIVLAAAGLIRLGLEKHATEFLSTDVMLPAVGQGALAIQSRENDDDIKHLLSRMDHNPTRRAVEAERAFARRLGADCRTPIAAYARAESAGLAIDGVVAAPSGKLLVRSRIVSDDPDAEKVGMQLAEVLLDKGAASILEAA